MLYILWGKKTVCDGKIVDIIIIIFLYILYTIK